MRIAYHHGMATQDDYIKTAFRIPRGIHADISAAAQAKGRSLNAELIARLQRSLGSDPEVPTKHLEERLVAAHMEIAVLQREISILKSILRNAAGIVRTALISGRNNKIPESDALWMTEEAKHFSKIASEDQENDTDTSLKQAK